MQLTQEQLKTLDDLNKPGNVFLTGAAGTGKSTLVREFLKGRSIKKFPIVASTGAAAVLVGGTTFHRFFGLGILEGGAQKTIERALNRKVLVKRLQKIEGVLIDEISMLSGEVLTVAESISRLARKNDSAWGGLKIIAVGDFLQLPPVDPYQRKRDWAFLSPVWEQTQFHNIELRDVVRSNDKELVQFLHRIREGNVDQEVSQFLNAQMGKKINQKLTRLFPFKKNVEEFNLEQLSKIKSQEYFYPTSYSGDEKQIESFKKWSPLPEVLKLKEGAYVMIRKNDPEERFVNGSTGIVRQLNEKRIIVELNDGPSVTLEKESFDLLDAEGKKIVRAENFPLNLAYAMTIHKAQGATIDPVWMDLGSLWEPGQGYVALSRARRAKGLYLNRWSKNSFQTDPQVISFYLKIRGYS